MLLLLGILAVSTAAILIKLALPFASPIAIAFHRLAFSAAIAIAIFLFTKRDQRLQIDRKQLGLLILSGILSPLVLKENVPRRFYVGVLFAFAGGLLIALLNQGNSGQSTLLGLVMALFSAWMIAGYLLVGRKIAAQMSTELYVSFVYTIAAIVLGVVMLLVDKTYETYQPNMYLLLFLLALVPQTLGHTSLNKAMKYLPARTVSLALLFEPIGSSILAILFLNEIPSAVEIAGGILILFGLVFASSAKANAA